MKTHLCFTAYAAIFVIIITCSGLFAQGDLVPPGGRPAPSMKTLDQVEPRTPISSLPYTISEPGSYYVTGNLSSTEHGIIIQSSGVTVDLMGFSMAGDGGTGDYGIYVAGASTNNPVDKLLVRGGSICDFGNGLRVKFTENSRFEQLLVSGSKSHGFLLTGNTGRCNGNTVVHCSVSGSTGAGFYLDGRNGQCNGNTIADCSISGNNSYGVWLNGGFSGQCNGNTIANCSISGNNSDGVYLRGDGGQCIGNTIRENTVSKNVNRGIALYKADGNRVEANHVWGTTGAVSYGIRTDSDTTGNFILKNTCVGQVNNFFLDIDDTYGPVVSSSGALVGISPWANFSR